MIFYLLINFTFLFAENSKSPTNKDYDEFISILEQVYKNGFDKPDTQLYPKVLKKFVDLIETYPESQWSIAVFYYLAKPFNSFKFDRNTSYDDILALTQNLKFSNDYSKVIFYHCVANMVFSKYIENYYSVDNHKLLYKNCTNSSYKPYLNYLLRTVYSDEISEEEKLNLINEILQDEKYKETLFYPEALKYKASYHFSKNQPQEALNILLEMTSEAFYKNKKWQEAYFVKNGIFESAFLAIIGAYAELKNIDKARAYLQIAEKKFKHNYDLKYYIEEVSLLESKKAR